MSNSERMFKIKFISSSNSIKTAEYTSTKSTPKLQMNVGNEFKIKFGPPNISDMPVVEVNFSLVVSANSHWVSPLHSMGNHHQVQDKISKVLKKYSWVDSDSGDTTFKKIFFLGGQPSPNCRWEKNLLYFFLVYSWTKKVIAGFFLNESLVREVHREKIFFLKVYPPSRYRLRSIF